MHDILLSGSHAENAAAQEKESLQWVNAMLMALTLF